MTEEQFESRLCADPAMQGIAALRGKRDVAAVDSFAEISGQMMEQERYIRRRNRMLFGPFCWRYWLDRYYAWNIARLKRLAGQP